MQDDDRRKTHQSGLGEASRLFVLLVVVLLLSFLTPDSAIAGIVTAPGGYKETETKFDWVFTWDGEGVEKGRPPNANLWFQEVNLIESFSLGRFEAFHNTAISSHNNESRKGDDFEFSLNLDLDTFLKITNDPRTLFFGEVRHLKLPKNHKDFYTLFYTRPPTQDDVVTFEFSGSHKSKPPKFTWSYEAEKDVELSVEASYPTADNQPGLDSDKKPVIVRSLSTGQKLEGTLPGAANEESATDYIILINDPGKKTTSTLAFFEGVPGDFRKAELGFAAEVFLDRGGFAADGFKVPALISDEYDLDVGIDLAKFLANPLEFDAFEQFDIVNGTSDLLPGFMIGTSDVVFDEVLGWITDEPLNGVVFKGGIIDGNTVPEPWSLTQIAFGLVGLGLSRRRARRIHQEGHSLIRLRLSPSD